MRGSAAIVCLAITAAACHGPLDRKRLAGQVRALRSTAREAALIVELEREGRAPAAYMEIQRGVLADRVRDGRDELARGAEPGPLEGLDRAAGEIATRLEEAVRTARDPAALTALEARLLPLERVLDTEGP
jgi:hypothetical protein